MVSEGMEKKADNKQISKINSVIGLPVSLGFLAEEGRVDITSKG